MRIAAAMLTFDVHRFKRVDMFETTLATLRAGGPDALTVVTNGSTDGTQDDVLRLGGIVDNGHTQIWYGMTVAINWCLQQEAEIVVFSADDIRYEPDWCERLRAFWADAPDNLKLTSLFLEPAWHWNRAYAARNLGWERALYRASAPGASWSFRACDWPIVGPIPEMFPGEDVHICQKLRAGGYDIAQLELAEHIGERRSAWGNTAWHIARRLNRERWGLPPPGTCPPPE